MLLFSHLKSYATVRCHTRTASRQGACHSLEVPMLLWFYDHFPEISTAGIIFVLAATFCSHVSE